MRKILHIDPDAAFRQGFSALLARRGVESAGAGTFTEALDILKTGRFACMILDLDVRDMPWREGLKLVRLTARGFPVLATAAIASKDAEAEARMEGVNFYHLKTFGDEELLEAVVEAMDMDEKSKKATRAKILTIDDDPDIQETLKAILEGAGYKVVQAFGKDEGKAKLAAEKPDLVLLDIMMESMTSGFQFLYETIGGKDKGKAHVPVLALTSISSVTGFAFSPSKDEDFFPADDYLPKPVDPKVLLERVAALLK